MHSGPGTRAHVTSGRPTHPPNLAPPHTCGIAWNFMRRASPADFQVAWMVVSMAINCSMLSLASAAICRTFVTTTCHGGCHTYCMRRYTQLGGNSFILVITILVITTYWALATT